jgi:hypothetical protein
MNDPAQPESKILPPSNPHVSRRILKTSIDGLSASQMAALDEAGLLCHPVKPLFTRKEMAEAEVLLLPPEVRERIVTIQLDINPPPPTPIVPKWQKAQDLQQARDEAIARGRKTGRRKRPRPGI